MAKNGGPVESYQEYLEWERKLEQLPDLPARPFLLPGDYPTGDVASAGQAKFEMQFYEQERDARQALSGHNAQPYAYCGPLSPAQAAQAEAEVAEYRVQRYGEPDSPPDMAPRFREGGGRPFTGLRG